MKTLSGIILAFILVIMLSSCAVVVHNNWGSNISDNDTSTMDDMTLKQEYDLKVKQGLR